MVSGVVCRVPRQVQDTQQSHLDSRGLELWLKPLNLSWLGGPYKRNGPSEEECVATPGSGVTDGSEPRMGYWGLSSGSLQVCFTTELQ